NQPSLSLSLCCFNITLHINHLTPLKDSQSGGVHFSQNLVLYLPASTCKSRNFRDCCFSRVPFTMTTIPKEPAQVMKQRVGSVLGKQTILKSDHFPGCRIND
ncbi:hypothetical protein GIB67_006213, partial [Kingdonia uniflora]